MRTSVMSDRGKEFRPDEKWSWVVLFAGFTLMALLHVPTMSYGILFAPVFESFGVSSTEIAWIGGIQFLLWNVTMLFLRALCQEFGWRSVAMVGNAMTAVSMLCSAFIPSPAILFLYYSVVGAIGSGTSMGVSFFVVSEYFEKRRGMALAFNSVGACFALLICPPLTVFLNNHYGSRGSCLILGAIMLNGIPFASLYHPTSWHKYPCQQTREEVNHHSEVRILTEDEHTTSNQLQKQIIKEKSNLILAVLKNTWSSFHLLKQQRMIHLCIAIPAMFTGYLLFQMWIPFAITDKGYSLGTASLCMSASAIANIIGRVSIAVIIDCSWFNRSIFFKFSMASLAISIFCFAYSVNLTLIVIFVSWWGYNIGVVLAMYITVLIDIMGLANFPSVFGLTALFVGGSISIITVLSGMIRDYTSFQIALSFIGIIVCIACLFLFTMRFAKKNDLKRELKGTSRHINIQTEEVL